jgi:hypothetical protein
MERTESWKGQNHGKDRIMERTESWKGQNHGRTES